MMNIPAIEINPAGKPKFTIIWLHGLGADGNDFVPIAQQLGLSSDLALRFVFPNAPSIPVSINQGYVMPAWFDIYQANLSAEVDEQGIQRSTDYLHDLIDLEKARGIPAERLILAGFSQGGLIALNAAISYPEKLLGVMALSTYLPAQMAASGTHKLEIFQAHGRMDNVIPYTVGVDSRRRLEQAGHHLGWHEYEMAHSVSPSEITDIRDWLLARISAE